MRIFKGRLLHTQSLINAKIEEFFSEYLSQKPEYSRLIEAMQYAMLSGGKRLRPFLLVSFAEMFKGDTNKAIEAGLAVEFLHNYSLVHDDLPAMDNDDYRRGNLTCHKKFDECTAILAGDALLTLAFEYLSKIDGLSAEVKLKLIQELSSATGFTGMCGGQMIDMIYEKERLSNKITSELKREIDRLKTGKLFVACCRMGGIIGGADDIELKHIEEFAKSFGEAFQLRDDLADNEIAEENKDKIRVKISDLKSLAQENLDKLNKDTTLLKELLDYLY